MPSKNLIRKTKKILTFQWLTLLLLVIILQHMLWLLGTLDVDFLAKFIVDNSLLRLFRNDGLDLRMI